MASVSQRGRHRNQLIGTCDRPLKCSGNGGARLTLLLAAQREHDRQLQPTSQQDRRIAGRVAEMSVDDIGVDGRALFAAQQETTTTP